MQPRQIENHPLPELIRELTGQETVPFGDAFIKTYDTSIGFEICEELFTPNSPHIALGLDGVEIFCNGSASHHQLGKLQTRLDLINGATTRTGGIYLYSNLQGVDGEQIYYDGSAMISVNGKLVAQGPQFSLKDVQVVTAKVDLFDLRVFRGLSQSLGNQGAAAAGHSFPQIFVPFRMTEESIELCDPPIQPLILSPQVEISYLLLFLYQFLSSLVKGLLAGCGIIYGNLVVEAFSWH